MGAFALPVALAAPVKRRFTALAVRNYRLYFAGQLVSQSGTWIQRMAQAWLVLDLTGSPIALGTVTALQFIPVLVLSLLGGVLTDRFPKRGYLMATQGGHMIQAFLLAALVLSGTVRLWHIYVLAALSRAQPLARRAVIEIAELSELSLLLLRRDFGSRLWFDAACQVANIRPDVLLESGAPHTLIALARAGYGVAVLPSSAPIPRGGLRAIPLVLRGVPVGGWIAMAWDPRRFLPPYAEQFMTELLAHARRAHPNRDVVRRVPRPPWP